MTTLCYWDTQAGLIQQTYSRQTLSMLWNYGEANPFSKATGSWDVSIQGIIKVLENAGKQVKIGVSVSREVPVYREEIYNKIQLENQKAILSHKTRKNVLSNLIKIKDSLKKN